MLLKFGAVLIIICGFLMVIYIWTHLLQRIVDVWSFLRMLKLRKLAGSRGPTLCQTVLEHGLNLLQNIPLNNDRQQGCVLVCVCECVCVCVCVCLCV